jgi:hypothetical protein
MAASGPPPGANHDHSPHTFKRTLERVSEMATTYLRELPEREAFRRPPDDVADRLLNAPLPQTSTPTEEILSEIERDILPYGSDTHAGGASCGDRPIRSGWPASCWPLL